jgi:hypothetical protein
MAEKQHAGVSEPAPYLNPNRLRTLGEWGRLVKTPRRLVRGVRRHGKRLWLSRRVRRAWWALRMRDNQNVCSVEINAQFGFFAQMTWCLWILSYCEGRGIIADLRLTSEIYRDRSRGSNWLTHYFDATLPITSEEIAKRVKYTKKVTELEDLEHLISLNMTLGEGSRILHKHLVPKPHITKIVDDLWHSVGRNGPVLGIHFRGTDKSWEAPRASWEHCLAVAETYMRKHADITAIFSASDEQEFIDFLARSIKGVPVYCHKDHYRNRTGNERPVFLDQGGGYEKGEDALVNALLLAKCSTLIRTTSTLSAWASLFNPEIKVILLNKPYQNNLWYPENEILKKSDTEYLPERRL